MCIHLASTSHTNGLSTRVFLCSPFFSWLTDLGFRKLVLFQYSHLFAFGLLGTFFLPAYCRIRVLLHFLPASFLSARCKSLDNDNLFLPSSPSLTDVLFPIDVPSLTTCLLLAIYLFRAAISLSCLHLLFVTCPLITTAFVFLR